MRRSARRAGSAAARTADELKGSVVRVPAEVFIKRGERTLASYLIRPLADQMERAFRER